jgi:hypothetical protein
MDTWISILLRLIARARQSTQYAPEYKAHDGAHFAESAEEVMKPEPEPEPEPLSDQSPVSEQETPMEPAKKTPEESTIRYVRAITRRVAKELAMVLNDVRPGATSERELLKSLRSVVRHQPRLRKLEYKQALETLLCKEENDSVHLAAAGEKEGR